MKVVLAYIEEEDISAIYVDGKLKVKDIIEDLFGYETYQILKVFKKKGIMQYDEVTISDVHVPPSELPEKLARQK